MTQDEPGDFAPERDRSARRDALSAGFARGTGGQTSAR
jgi:hypothetical protein